MAIDVVKLNANLCRSKYFDLRIFNQKELNSTGFFGLKNPKKNHIFFLSLVEKTKDDFQLKNNFTAVNKPPSPLGEGPGVRHKAKQ